MEELAKKLVENASYTVEIVATNHALLDNLIREGLESYQTSSNSYIKHDYLWVRQKHTLQSTLKEKDSIDKLVQGILSKYSEKTGETPRISRRVYSELTL